MTSNRSNIVTYIIYYITDIVYFAICIKIKKKNKKKTIDKSNLQL